MPRSPARRYGWLPAPESRRGSGRSQRQPVCGRGGLRKRRQSELEGSFNCIVGQRRKRCRLPKVDRLGVRRLRELLWCDDSHWLRVRRRRHCGRRAGVAERPRPELAVLEDLRVAEADDVAAAAAHGEPQPADEVLSEVHEGAARRRPPDAARREGLMAPDRRGRLRFEGRGRSRPRGRRAPARLRGPGHPPSAPCTASCV